MHGAHPSSSLTHSIPRAPSTLDQLQDGEVGAAPHAAGGWVLSTDTVSGQQQGRPASKHNHWSLSDMGILFSSCFPTGESCEQSSPAGVLVCQEEGDLSPGAHLSVCTAW